MADENNKEQNEASENANKSLNSTSNALKKLKIRFNELESTTDFVNRVARDYAKALETQISAFGSSIDELKAQRVEASRVRDIYGQYSGTFSGIIALGKQEIAQASINLKIAQDRLALAQAGLVEDKKLKDAVSEQISAKKQEIENMVADRDLNDKERSVLAEFVSAKAKQIEAINQDLGVSKSLLDTAQQEAAASKSKLTALRAEEDSIQSSIRETNAKIAELEKRGKQGKFDYAGEDRSVPLTQEEEAQLAALQMSIIEQKRKADQLKEARKAEVAYRETLDSAVKQLTDEVTAKESQLGEITDEHDEAKSKLADLNRQRRYQTTEIVEARSALRDLQEEEKNLTEEIEKNAGAIADLTEEVNAKAQAEVNAKLKLYAKAINDASNKSSKVAKALLDLEKSIRDTQKQFGISAGQAANLKISQFGQAISSAATAIFSLGSRAAVSMEEIQAAQSEFQKEFGGVISSDAAEKLASQAKEMGVSVSEMAKARRAFLTTAMGDVGKAIDQQNRAIAAFEAKGLTARDAMEFIGSNAELVARSGTRFQDSLMSAAASAKKIGVDLSKVNQVGDNIIGNFEGFLESMAELGAMGFGFDTSALAEIAESGDTGALFEELRSQLGTQGKDLTDLRRSEQLALSQAFGMDIGEFQRMAGIETEGGGETMENLQKGSNALLEKLVNLVGGLGKLFTGVSTILGVTHTLLLMDISRKLGAGGILDSISRGTGSVARGVGSAARGVGRGIGSVARGVGRGIGSVARGAGRVTQGIAGGLSRTAAGASRLGGVAKFGARALGKVALPLTAVMGAYDAFSGFRADKDASLGQRFKNAGSSMLAGMTFGLLGKNAGEIAAAAAMRGQPATSSVRSPSAPAVLTPSTSGTTADATTRERTETPSVNVDLTRLERKLDQVVQAIGNMTVKLDSVEVGKVMYSGQRRAAQSVMFRDQGTRV